MDAAVILASWAVLHVSAGFHPMEPSADDRVFRVRQGGPQARSSSEHRCSRSLRRAESGDAERDHVEGIASISTTAAAAASAIVGAAHDRALDQVGGRAWRQWIFYRRAQLAPEEERRTLLRAI